MNGLLNKLKTICQQIEKIIRETYSKASRSLGHMFKGKSPVRHESTRKSRFNGTIDSDNITQTDSVRSSKFPALHFKRNSSGDETQRVSILSPRKKQRSFLLTIFMTFLKITCLFLVIGGIAGFGAVLGIAKAYVDTTPILDVAKIDDQSQTSFIYDANGNLITPYSGTENRVWVSIDEIPVTLQHAFIAIEDERFETHSGIDLKRIAGAFLSNFQSDSTQGGSTITQQLIKMRLLSPERTYKRKIQEAYLAIQLEKQYSKDEILEAYLNTIHLGGSNYGVKVAAQDYFGKDLDQLTLRECAMLAGITQNPYSYNPRLNTYVYDRISLTNKRTDTVLLNMYKCGYITKTQYDEAKVETVNILEKSASQQSIYDMPYFVEYALYDVEVHILKQRNLPNTSQNRQIVENEIRTGGYSIYTTVDPTVQLSLEDTIFNWDKFPALANASDSSLVVRNPDGSTSSTPQPQAAAAIVDHETGYLVGIVGGRSQPTAYKTLNRAYQARMGVGSSIKPLTVYGPALDMGLSPASIILNVPGAIEGWDTDKGYPNNYGGGGFTGSISMREGLKQSLNVVAARILMEDVGLDVSYNYLVNLGITTGVNKDGPGLALGTSGITVIEMAAAFGCIANEGVYQEPLSFTKVVDSNGNVILDSNDIQIKRQVYKPTTAWLLVDMLTDAVRSGTGTRAKVSGMTVAGKTGTNSDARGVFFSGMTPYYSAAVWVGSDANKPLYSNAQGGKEAAPIFSAFMTKIDQELNLEDKPIIDETASDLGLVKKEVCGVSGLLATDACREDTKYGTVTDWFVKGTEPTVTCNMHREVLYCPAEDKLATPYCPVDDLIKKPVLLVPEGSPLRDLSKAVLDKYYPNALVDYPDALDIENYSDDPKYADYFCSVHTKEWAENQEKFVALSLEAESLINTVNSQLTNAVISDDDKNKIKTAVNSLKENLKSKTYSDSLQTSYNTLLHLKETLLDVS